MCNRIKNRNRNRNSDLFFARLVAGSAAAAAAVCVTGKTLYQTVSLFNRLQVLVQGL